MGKVLKIRVFVVVILAAAVAAAVATLLNQKQQLEAMDAAGRRDYLGDKLGGRVPDEQIDRIAAAISEKLDAKKPVEDVKPVEEVVEEAASAVEESGEEAAEGTNPEA